MLNLTTNGNVNIFVGFLVKCKLNFTLFGKSMCYLAFLHLLAHFWQFVLNSGNLIVFVCYMRRFLGDLCVSLGQLFFFFGPNLGCVKKKFSTD